MQMGFRTHFLWVQRRLFSKKCRTPDNTMVLQRSCVYFSNCMIKIYLKTENRLEQKPDGTIRWGWRPENLERGEIPKITRTWAEAKEGWRCFTNYSIFSTWLNSHSLLLAKVPTAFYELWIYAEYLVGYWEEISPEASKTRLLHAVCSPEFLGNLANTPQNILLNEEQVLFQDLKFSRRHNWNTFNWQHWHFYISLSDFLGLCSSHCLVFWFLSRKPCPEKHR